MPYTLNTLSTPNLSIRVWVGCRGNLLPNTQNGE